MLVVNLVTESAGFAQCPRVSFIGLDAPVAGGVHGREVRVGDDHLMAEGFEVAGTPLTFS
jgi:hypothetical protein